MITLYHRPTCTKSREAKKLLDEKGVQYEIVEYGTNKLSQKKLKELISKIGITPMELMRTKEKLFRELDIKNKNYTDTELIRLMIAYPDLMERPSVEKGAKAAVGRPIENIEAIL